MPTLLADRPPATGLALPRAAGRRVAASLAVVACVALGHPGRAWATERLAGNLLSVDRDKREITLIDAGRRHVVVYDDDTRIRQGGADRAIDDLHRGDRIVVSLAGSEPARATLIAIAGAAAPAAGSAGFGGAVPGFAPGLNARNRPR